MKENKKRNKKKGKMKNIKKQGIWKSEKEREGERGRERAHTFIKEEKNCNIFSRLSVTSLFSAYKDEYDDLTSFSDPLPLPPKPFTSSVYMIELKT